MSYRYTVTAFFSDLSVAHEWIEWLCTGHCQDVLDAGALRFEIIELDGDEIGYDVRYDFADRAAFEHYERSHAPRLRQEGLERFPSSRGVRYARSTGTVLHSEPHS